MTLEILQKAGLFTSEKFDGMSPNRLQRLIAEDAPDRWTDVSDHIEEIVRRKEKKMSIVNREGKIINI